MVQFSWENASRDIRGQIEEILAGFKDILGDKLIGVYLHGSLAMGCFNPSHSDLDLLTVTRRRMSVEEKREFAQLLLAVSERPSPVEVSVLPIEYIEPWEHPARYDFHYSEDHRSRMEEILVGSLSEEWNEDVLRDEDLAAHIKLIRCRGIALVGPPPSEVFPDVPEADFIKSVLLDVLSPEFGLNPKSDMPVYMILNACRTLAYLQTRQYLSKDEGGLWALGRMPDQYHSLIRGALNIYRGIDDGHEFPSTLLGEFVTDVRSEIINLSSGWVTIQSKLVELNIAGADRGSNDQPDKEHQ